MKLKVTRRKDERATDKVWDVGEGAAALAIANVLAKREDVIRVEIEYGGDPPPTPTITLEVLRGEREAPAVWGPFFYEQAAKEMAAALATRSDIVSVQIKQESS